MGTGIKHLLNEKGFVIYSPFPRLQCSFWLETCGCEGGKIGNIRTKNGQYLFSDGEHDAIEKSACNVYENIAKDKTNPGTESQKPRQRFSNADRKVFATPESFCDKFIIC